MAAFVRLRALDWRVLAASFSLLGFACGSDGGSDGGETGGGAGDSSQLGGTGGMTQPSTGGAGATAGGGTGATSTSGQPSSGGTSVTGGTTGGGTAGGSGTSGGAGTSGTAPGGGTGPTGGTSSGGTSGGGGGALGGSVATGATTGLGGGGSSGGTEPTAGSSGGVSTCVPGVETGDQCDPAVDTAECVRSTRTCTCGSDALWACTSSGGQGGTGGSSGAPAVGGGGGTELGGEGGMAANGGHAGSGPTGGQGGSGGDPTLEWLPSWGTSIQKTEASNVPQSHDFEGNTVRQFIWPTYSGDQIRLQLSNEKGTSPVEMTKVHIAMAAGSGAIDPATDAEFTFEGSASVTIPAGDTTWSDPLDFDLQELELTAITIQFGATVPTEITGHPGARTNTYIANGDLVSQASMSAGDVETQPRWYFIDTLEVMAPADAYAISVLGDSITDGYGVTPDDFARWPDFMTLAIKEDPAIADKVSVLNAGMGANNLLTSTEFMDAGKDRVDRDILARPKVKWVIVLHGVNDIGAKTDMGLVGQVTDAYQEIIDKCHDAGILVYGSPITPFATATNGYADGQALQIREGINDWVLTSGAFDEVIDLAAAVADPANAAQLNPPYSNDGLHPSRDGYEAMGNAVDLSLFYETMQ